jgi:hypothetical protein
MLLLSARDLEERNQAKKSVKKELYTRILVQISRKIDLYHTLGKSECTIHIPEYVFGFPTFDIIHMTLYIHRQLIRLGYRASILTAGVIHTAWGPKKIKKQNKKKEQEREQEDELPNLANLKKAADSLRKKYEFK